MVRVPALPFSHTPYRHSVCAHTAVIITPREIFSRNERMMIITTYITLPILQDVRHDFASLPIRTRLKMYIVVLQFIL